LTSYLLDFSAFYVDTIDEVLVMDVFLSIAFLVICGAVGALIGGLPVYLFFRLLSRELKKRGLL
jgi:hypothetical protein